MSVALEIVGQVATITLDRPERRNAFDAAMGRGLEEAYRSCDADEQVRCIVLTGRPPAFCAGADLSRGEGTFFLAPDAPFSAAGIATPAFELSTPVIAAVNGHAIGIGLTLALQCDIRIFAADATYGVVQVRRGVMGDAYSHWTLPRLVGVAAAAEILLTGRSFDGHEAQRLGLCSRVLPADEVLAAAIELATEIATTTAPRAVALSKRLLWRSLEMDPSEVEAAETEGHRILMAEPDAAEGGRAAAERRPPRFTGRPREDGLTAS